MGRKSHRGFHKSNFDFLPIPERSQFPPRDFVKKQRSAHTKRTREEEELRPSLPPSPGGDSLLNRPQSAPFSNRAPSERVVEGLQIFARQILAAVAQSVCRTPPPEKVRKTAACRRPRLLRHVKQDDERGRYCNSRGGIDGRIRHRNNRSSLSLSPLDGHTKCAFVRPFSERLTAEWPTASSSASSAAVLDRQTEEERRGSFF